MEAAARALLVVVVVALFVNYAQGGAGRVKRWTVRTLTGRDLVGPPGRPMQGPPAPPASTTAALIEPAPATPTHNVMV